MATNANTQVATPAAKKARVVREPVSLSARIKSQLATATLRMKISKEELDMLAEHCTKMKSFL